MADDLRPGIPASGDQQAGFQAGLHEIIDTLIDGLKTLGLQVDYTNADFDGWEPGDIIPGHLPVGIKVDGMPTVKALFSRKEIDASADGPVVATAADKVRHIVEHYAMLLTPPGAKQ
jgi:hypothetical protein